MKKRKNNKLPPQLIAARKANRELEFETLGNGFHSNTTIVQNKKRYNRKKLKNNITHETNN